MGEVAWSALGGAVVLVLREGVAVLLKYMSKRHEIRQGELSGDLDRRRQEAELERARRREEEEARREEDATTIKELKALQRVYKEDIQDCRHQIHELRDQLQAANNEILLCQMDRARQAERITALEDALDRANIPHKKFDPAAGSDVHRPLPQSGRFRRPPTHRRPEDAPPAEGDPGE